MSEPAFEDFPCLHFEVQKRKWNTKEIRWTLRTGDLDGSITTTNITKEDLIKEIVDEINKYDEENND